MAVQIPSSSSTGQGKFIEGIKQEPILVSALANGTSSNDDTKQQIRPAFTFVKLVLQALKSTPDYKMTSSEIIAFIQQHYTYYRNNNNCKSWQSQVHQVLRSKPFFKKIPRADGDNGRGFYWQLDANSKDYIDCAFELGRGRLRNHLKDTKSNVVTAMNGRNNVESVVPSTSETVQELSDSGISDGPPPAKLQKKAAKPRKSAASKPVLKQPTVGVRRGRGTWQRKRSANQQYVQDSNSNIANEDEPVQIGDFIEGNPTSSSSENVMGPSAGTGTENDSQTESARHVFWQIALEQACNKERLCRLALDFAVANSFANGGNGNPSANNPANNSQIPMDLSFGNDINSQSLRYATKLKLQLETIYLKYNEFELCAKDANKRGMLRMIGEMAIDSKLLGETLVEASKTFLAE